MIINLPLILDRVCFPGEKEKKNYLNSFGKFNFRKCIARPEIEKNVSIDIEKNFDSILAVEKRKDENIPMRG